MRKIGPEVTLWQKNKSRQSPHMGVKINTAAGLQIMVLIQVKGIYKL